MSPEMQKKIDGLTYEEALRLNRFEPIGSPYFQGEAGEAFALRFDFLNRITPHEVRVAASKRIGW